MNRPRLPALLTTTLSLALLSAPASAHLDPGNNPPIVVMVTLDELRIQTQNSVNGQATTIFPPGSSFRDTFGLTPADGFDNNAEFSVSVFLTHVGHGGTATTLEKSDMVTSVWEAGTRFYSHKECSPQNVITVAGAVVEVDQSGWSNLTANLAGAGAGLALANLPGAVVGFLISQLASMNGNDSFGTYNGAIPPAGEVTLPFSSKEGSGEVVFHSEHIILPPETGCNGAVQVGAAHIPSNATSKIYDHLGLALTSAGELYSEESEVAALHAAELADVKESAAAIALGLGRTAAAVLVDRAQGLDGNEEAIELFGYGDELALAGDGHGALLAYRYAFEAARTAMVYGYPGEDASLPLTLVASPEVFATRAGSEFSLGATVVGAAQESEVYVVDAPTELEVSVVEGGLVVLVDENAAPGDYTIELAASDGEQQTQASIEVRVGEPKGEREAVTPEPGLGDEAATDSELIDDDANTGATPSDEDDRPTASADVGAEPVVLDDGPAPTVMSCDATPSSQLPLFGLLALGALLMRRRFS
jgi:MYXO-CTERM domain-containing protein